MNIKYLFFNISSAFVIKIGSAGLSFLMFVTLARGMSTESYGNFGAAFSLATFLSVCGGLGQQTLIHRYGGKYLAEEKHGLLKGLITEGYRLIFLGSLFVSLVYFGLAESLINNNNQKLVLGTCFLALVISLAEYQSRAGILFVSAPLALIPRDIIWRFLIFVIALAVIQVDIIEVTADGWIWLLASVLFAIFLCQRYLMLSTSALRAIFGSPSKYDRMKWFQTMWGVWMILIVTRSSGALSVVITGAMMGPSATGPYFAALRTAQLLTLLQIAVNIIVSPVISREIANKDEAAIDRVCSFVALLGGAGALLGLLFFWQFGSDILNLFGRGFEVALVPMLILSGGYAISMLVGPIQPLLQMSGHERPLLLMLLLSNGIAIAAMPFAISWGGIEGSALALAFGLSAWSIMGWLYSKLILRKDPSIFGVLKSKKFFKSF